MPVVFTVHGKFGDLKKENILKDCDKLIYVSQFVKDDLYIWANDFDGIITAHPKKPLKGKNMYRYKDKAGTQLFKDFIDKVKADGSGWVDYVWDHPTKGDLTPKTSYVIGIGENQLIGAGVYK